MATATAASGDDPFRLNPDGSAADPAAFQAALRADAAKVAALEADPELKAALLGGDVAAMQALLQQAYRVRCTSRVVPFDEGSERTGLPGAELPSACTQRRNCVRACRPPAACATWSRINALVLPPPPSTSTIQPQHTPQQIQLERATDAGRWMAERTIDAQRASATVRPPPSSRRTLLPNRTTPVQL